ncbi:MAG: methyltransferase domain-containing protein [Pseudomonadales bacterium]|nr:methyltransferase domain-containing protein [Pseudomonadales bacterium]
MNVPSLRLRYQTHEFGDIDIHVCTLRDNQQFSDPAGEAEDLGISSATWPLFGIVWPSSVVLANYVLGFDTRGKRILEVGCGIGLSSLLLNKLEADITATDYHPEAEPFLARNTGLNNGARIPFERVDWAADDDELGLFDLIIGSDVLYEDEHVALLSDFLDSHANDHCEIILVDPGRGKKGRLVRKMTALGFTCTEKKPAAETLAPAEFKGHILNFIRLSR